MRLSAWTIEPYFLEMACRCIARRPSQNLREQLAVIGRNAERAMLTATGGSNTHKGAIWILGLLVSAAAMHTEEPITVRELAGTAQQIASFEDRAAPMFLSHGDLVAARYFVTGARGEAVSGFPNIVQVGLPTLRGKRAQGLNEVEARLDTLLTIMSTLEDTCLLYRGGSRALAAAQRGAISVLDAGGTTTLSGMRQLRIMERTLLDLGVSPGGSADLLAATLFMDAVECNCESVQPDRSEGEGIDGTP
jgi:triphosphoribosyl-dephospho-CoA synthase